MLTTEREAETYEEVDTIVFTDYFREAFVFTSILLKSPSVPRAPPRDAPAGTPSVSHAGHVNRRGLRVVQRVRAFGVVGGHERVGVLRDAAKPLDLSTIVLVEHANGEITGWTKSTAVLRMFQALGGAWSVVGVLGMVVPKVIRDAIYTFIAKHRIKIFGTNGGRCKLPDAVIRKRINRALPKELLGE